MFELLIRIACVETKSPAPARHASSSKTPEPTPESRRGDLQYATEDSPPSPSAVCCTAQSKSPASALNPEVYIRFRSRPEVPLRDPSMIPLNQNAPAKSLHECIPLRIVLRRTTFACTRTHGGRPSPPALRHKADLTTGRTPCFNSPS